MPKDPVQLAYDRLATGYETRWTDYCRETLAHTIPLLDPRPGDRVLDLACGTGWLLDDLLDRGGDLRTVGMDLSFEMLRQAAARVRSGPGAGRLLQGSAPDLPFAAGTFDWIVSTNAFHFFPDRAACLREIHRVLAPGGRLVLTDWCADFLACRLCDLWLRVTDPAHRPPLSHDACRQALESNGFAIEQLETFRAGWIWGMMKVRCVKA